MFYRLINRFPTASKIAIALGLIGILFFPGDRVFLGWESASAQVPLGRVVLYTANLTPVATAASIQTVEQAFTVTGVAFQPTDILFVNGPVPTSLCPPVTIRASAANTVQIGFSTLTAAACTPAAGLYQIVAIR